MNTFVKSLWIKALILLSTTCVSALALAANAPTLTGTGINGTSIEHDEDYLYSHSVADTNDDGETFSSMTLTVSNVSNGADEILVISFTYIELFDGNAGALDTFVASGGGNFSVAVAAGTATITVTDLTATEAELEYLVLLLRYITYNDDPVGDRVVTITSITDSGVANNTGAPNLASTISVIPVNDPPTLDLLMLNPEFTQGGAAVHPFGMTSASTVEAGQLFTAMTLTVTNVSNGADEILTIGGTDVALTDGNAGILAGIGDFSVSVDADTTTVSVTGMTRNTTQMEALVDGITYRNTATPPDTAAIRRVWLIGLEDNGANGGNDVNNSQFGYASAVTVVLSIDATAPEVSSINRQTPAGASTNATSVTYRATFSENVTGVDASDFTLTSTGTANGNISAVNPVSASVYDVTVNGISGNGTLRLDLNNAGTGIADDAANPIASGYSAGQTYTLDTTPPALPAANIVINNQSDPHQVILTFTKALDNATLGAAIDWTLTANGGTPVYSVASVGLSDGNTVTLTLAPVDLNNSATMISNAAANAHLQITPPATLQDTIGNAYAAGLVTEAGATHVLETSTPMLAAISATASDAISGTLDATSSEQVRVYWITVATAAMAPNVAQVRAQVDYAGVTVTASGSGVFPAAAGTIAIGDVLPVSSYDLYLVAEDAAGNLSATVSTTTWTPLLAAPLAITGTASNLSQTGATLNGHINDNGDTTAVSFDYGKTSAYGSNVAATTGGTITAGAGYSAASVAIDSLTCGTTYHFRISGVNDIGTSDGADASFTTLACTSVEPEEPEPELPTAMPAAATGTALDISQTSAMLTGRANPGGLATTVSFDFGTTTAYGASVQATTGGLIPANAGEITSAVIVGELVCGTSYHFRINAANERGNVQGDDASFTTADCDEPDVPNPFNPPGTQTESNLEPTIDVEPSKAPSDIVTNLDKLDNRVGISDNGVVVVLDNDLQEPVKFRDDPPDNVLISMPSQKPLDVQMNGNTMNITIDPETPNPPRQTILSTTTLLLPDGSQGKGLQLVQGEASISNDAPNGALGGLELSKDSTLRDLVAQAGSGGGSAGFRKSSDGSGSVSAESGEVRVTVRLKTGGTSTLLAWPTGQMSRVTFAALVDTTAVTDTLTLTLLAGEVARFDAEGELLGVFLGSLSGTAGKTGDALELIAPESVADFPTSTLLFEGNNESGRLGMSLRDFLNTQLAGVLELNQRSDGLVVATSPQGGRLYGRAVVGFEVVPGTPDGTSRNPDGSVNLVYGGIRSTWQPMLKDSGDLAEHFLTTAGMVTEVLENGLLQVSGDTPPNTFFVGQPRFDLLAADGTAPGISPADATGAALFYTNANGERQQLDAAFLDPVQVQAAAAMRGWDLTRRGYDLIAQSPEGESYRVIPDFRIEILDASETRMGVIDSEAGRLYFYYVDEALRQGFSLRPD